MHNVIACSVNCKWQLVGWIPTAFFIFFCLFFGWLVYGLGSFWISCPHLKKQETSQKSYFQFPFEKKSGALGLRSYRATTATKKWLPSWAGHVLPVPRAHWTCFAHYTPCLALWVCSAQTLFKGFLIHFMELPHKCNFPLKENDRCFPLIGSSQCQNVVPVAFLIFMQNFAGFFFLALQESSFGCSRPGNMMRSAFVNRSAKCPEKLLTVAVTATFSPRIMLMAIRWKPSVFHIFVLITVSFCKG